MGGGKGEGWMAAHGQGASAWAGKASSRGETTNYKKEKCDHWMARCLPEEEVGQACCNRSHAVNLSYMIMHNKTSQKCKVHFNMDEQTMIYTADKPKEANAQAPAVAVYLLWTTFSKGHLTEPVPSGGLRLRGAGGHLSGPTARGVGGGGKGGGGGGSWGGRTSREKGTAPPTVRAVPGGL